MKRILVPTDFSPAARNATNYAASLAKAFQAEIHLLHVYTEPVPAVEGGSATVLLENEVRQELQSRITKEKGFIKTAYEVPVKEHLCTGFRSDAVEEASESLNADLIVMGRNITKKNMIFGSTILKTIRRTDVPVLIIPQNVSFTPPKKIVLAVDFEEIVYHKNLDALGQVVKQFDAALSVLHVERKELGLSWGEVAVKMQLNRAMSKLDYTFEKVENDNTEQGILNFVNSHPTDMLAMIAHKHSFLARLFRDIHTPSVSFQVHLPLLVLKN